MPAQFAAAPGRGCRCLTRSGVSLLSSSSHRLRICPRSSSHSPSLLSVYFVCNYGTVPLGQVLHLYLWHHGRRICRHESYNTYTRADICCHVTRLAQKGRRESRSQARERERYPATSLCTAQRPRRTKTYMGRRLKIMTSTTPFPPLPASAHYSLNPLRAARLHSHNTKTSDRGRARSGVRHNKVRGTSRRNLKAS
ncbi:hypothetical protein VTO73DRAFT_13386 [Trametes versicolor]